MRLKPLLVIANLMFPCVALAQTQVPAAPTTPITREELPNLVRQILESNPDMVAVAMEKYKEKKAAEVGQAIRDAITKNHDNLVNNPDSPAIGNKDGDIKIVEFFDYRCGYCKRFAPDAARLVKEDANIQIIFKELPILSDDSKLAAKAALAVHRLAKEKYFDYHLALMKASGKIDEKNLLETARKLGINSAKLKAEMTTSEVSAIVDNEIALATELKIDYTPALIINDEMHYGETSYDTIKKAIEEARKAKTPPAATPVAPAAAPIAPAN